VISDSHGQRSTVSRHRAAALIGASLAAMVLVRLTHEWLISRLGLGILNLSWAWVDDYLIGTVLLPIYLPPLLIMPPPIRSGGFGPEILDPRFLLAEGIGYIAYTAIVAYLLASILISKNLFNRRTLSKVLAALLVIGIVRHIAVPVRRWREARDLPSLGSS